MSTTSTIAKVNADGSVTQIYVHWDGFLEGVGLELKHRYDVPDLIDALLAKGDHSQLLGKAVSYRSLGESDVEPVTYTSLDEYVREANAEDYNYLYTLDGVWTCSPGDLYNFREYQGEEFA